MHELCDLKKLFETHGVKIASSQGHTLTTKKGDAYTIILGVFHKNGIPIDEKELVASVVPTKKTKKK